MKSHVYNKLCMNIKREENVEEIFKINFLKELISLT